MDHVKNLYEISKLTRDALENVEKGLGPYREYHQIKSIIDSDYEFSRREELREMVRNYLKILVLLLAGAGAVFYGFRGTFVMLYTERFWPAFGYVLFAAFLASVVIFIVTNFMDL